jgi:hypothetical protein
MSPLGREESGSFHARAARAAEDENPPKGAHHHGGVLPGGALAWGHFLSDKRADPGGGSG